VELADGLGAAQPAGDGAALVSPSQPAEGGALLKGASLSRSVSLSLARARALCLSLSQQQQHFISAYSQRSSSLRPVCAQMHGMCIRFTKC